MIIQAVSLMPRSTHPSSPWQKWTIAVTLWMFLVTGCMFNDLKREIQEENITYRMSGHVEGITRADGDAFVLLYAKQGNGLQLELFTVPDEFGNFSFMVTPNTYFLAAFEDHNANRRHDPSEPVGVWGDADEIVISQGPKTDDHILALTGLVLKLTPGQFPIPDVIASVENIELAAPSLIKLGQLADWDDPEFDDEHGSIGFWKPMTFLRQHGAGIYFMEPYDRHKIPILFVHGAAGTPRAWKPLADSLDKQHFQPWVFYYPSGLRLTRIATVLNGMVEQLQNDYGFERMGVVAHSMGGLVSRAFILNHLVEDGLGTVRVFVSISTPWGGLAMAAKGVEHAPEAIPSWYDVVPNSDFIKRIFDNSLHPQVPHYLIFSYHGNSSMYMANNDGTVEVSSQLDIRAQDDAATVWGLDEDHMSILSSAKTMEYLNRALASAFPKKAF